MDNLEPERPRRRETDKPVMQAMRYGLSVAVAVISFLSGQWYHRVERYITKTDNIEKVIVSLHDKDIELGSAEAIQSETLKEVVHQLQDLNVKMAVMIDHDKRHFGEK